MGSGARAWFAVLACATLCAAGCTSARPAGRGESRRDGHPGRHRTRSASRESSPGTSPHRSRTRSPAPASTPAQSTESTSATGTPPTAAADAQQLLARMTLAERAGQLLMVDCPSTSVGPATVTAIRDHHVGSVILDGTSTAGVAATAAVTAQLRRVAPRRVGLFIATDQEGGEVQRLQGPGFSAIPSALVQGGWAPDQLRLQAEQWGEQLRQAGVNVNLAPVLDTVPAGFGSNPPIGDLDREYGHQPIRVTRHALAYAAGMRAAGVVATGKHFPGLGRVRGNTDTSSGVTDTVTRRRDAYLRPFAAAAHAHLPFMMISTAIYEHLDPQAPAAFSHAIVTGILRGRFGFGGVVISDDLGAAAQVRSVPVGQRAVRFVRAGGDIVLTVDAGQAATMTHALIRHARASARFRRRVDAAALRVLQAKQRAGLLR